MFGLWIGLGLHNIYYHIFGTIYITTSLAQYILPHLWHDWRIILRLISRFITHFSIPSSLPHYTLCMSGLWLGLGLHSIYYHIFDTIYITNFLKSYGHDLLTLYKIPRYNIQTPIYLYTIELYLVLLSID